MSLDCAQRVAGSRQLCLFAIARELAREPKLLVSYYPTRGMDVPSAEAARAVLRALQLRLI